MFLSEPWGLLYEYIYKIHDCVSDKTDTQRKEEKMNTSSELRKLLNKIDHRGYPAYKELRGAYHFPGYVLSIDHVQGDPFAAPSKVSLHLTGQEAGFSPELYDTREKRIMLQDYLLRQFGRKVETFSFQAKGSGKSGLMSVSRPGQEIIEHSGCEIRPEDGSLVLRMEIGFPANGRTVNSRELEKIFFDYLPECVRQALVSKSLRADILRQNADLAEDQTYIRKQLKEQGLVAFIADGAILPRESGVSRRPMKNAVPFQSPESMAVEMKLPHAGIIRGMGIPKGITLIVGGGYHGKSTLLKAIELGVYNHIAGDGREYVITDDSAMKIRAEDGRSIQNVDISMFINHLPNGKDTTRFHTEDASGSTSQAANVVEAMEAGTQAFLIDEDTSATNFMVRDALMQKVVSRDQEPITPFVDRIRQIYEQFGISTILVAGSSGSYFQKADRIVQMDCYQPKDITERAKAEASQYPSGPESEQECILPDFMRCPKPVRMDTGRLHRGGQDRRGGRGNESTESGNRGERVKIKTTALDTVTINRENIDMRYVEQLVDSEQLVALGNILTYIIKHNLSKEESLQKIVSGIAHDLHQKGFAAVCEGSYLPSNLAMPRAQEIFACLNRFRKLNFK